MDDDHDFDVLYTSQEVATLQASWRAQHDDALARERGSCRRLARRVAMLESLLGWRDGGADDSSDAYGAMDDAILRLQAAARRYLARERRMLECVGTDTLIAIERESAEDCSVADVADATRIQSHWRRYAAQLRRRPTSRVVRDLLVAKQDVHDLSKIILRQNQLISSTRNAAMASGGIGSQRARGREVKRGK